MKLIPAFQPHRLPQQCFVFDFIRALCSPPPFIPSFLFFVSSFSSPPRETEALDFLDFAHSNNHSNSGIPLSIDGGGGGTGLVDGGIKPSGKVHRLISAASSILVINRSYRYRSFETTPLTEVQPRGRGFCPPFTRT